MDPFWTLAFNLFNLDDVAFDVAFAIGKGTLQRESNLDWRMLKHSHSKLPVLSL